MRLPGARTLRAVVANDRLIPLLLIAGVWELTARAGVLPAYLIPPLSEVLRRLVELSFEDLPLEILRSLERLTAGLLCAIVVGLTLGTAMGRIAALRALLDPALRSLYPLPKSALIPIVIIWFGLGDAANITLIFMGCLLPIVVASYNATREIDTVLVWSARFLGTSELRIIFDIIIPGSLPQILNAIRTALSLAFILVTRHYTFWAEQTDVL